VEVVRELNRYHGLEVGALRRAPPADVPQIAPESSPRLALTHSTAAPVATLFEDAESCAKEVVSR
jgi:hypothetical protein